MKSGLYTRSLTILTFQGPQMWMGNLDNLMNPRFEEIKILQSLDYKVKALNGKINSF
jgi:hypothetical protein